MFLRRLQRTAPGPLAGFTLINAADQSIVSQLTDGQAPVIANVATGSDRVRPTSTPAPPSAA